MANRQQAIAYQIARPLDILARRFAIEPQNKEDEGFREKKKLAAVRFDRIRTIVKPQ